MHFSMCNSWKNFKRLHLLVVYLESLEILMMIREIKYKASLKTSVLSHIMSKSYVTYVLFTLEAYQSCAHRHCALTHMLC